jgi:predicted nucleic acid-binding protein
VIGGYFFLDASAIVKYYHEEDGTDQLDKWLKVAGARYGMSQLGVLEVHSAFAKKLGGGEITEEAFRMLCTRFFYDRVNGLFEVHPLENVHYVEAERIIIRNVKTNPGAADVLHIAVGLHCRANYFVSSDTLQLKLANVESGGVFEVLNPSASSS